MAYAYPSDPAASTHSLIPTRQGFAGPATSRGSSRKGSDDQFDVLNEVKAKIEEDESYLQFFNDRIKLEEEYINGMNRLYNRSKAVDTLHDDAYRREEKMSIRRAWDEVRDYTQREIQAREAMVGAMKESVVKDLQRLRDEQARIRQGLRDSIRKSNDMYEDYSRNTLAKLKRTYWQRCQALEDHRRQEHAIAMQAKLLSDSSTSPVSTPLKEHPNAMTFPNPSVTFSPPTTTGPLSPSSNPAQLSPDVTFDPSARDRDGSGDRGERKGHGRIRAGSASGLGSGDSKSKEMFNDLAQQSKKGFKAMMEKFGGDKEHRERDDGFVVVSGTGDEVSGGSGLQRRGTGARGDPTRGMGTMRGVKVKRDADEADKAYRLGVFHLESLRLQRDKLHTSGVRNLEEFNDDLNQRLLKALTAYVDALEGTAATNGQNTQVAREAIAQVNLDRDTSLFRTRLKNVDTQRTLPIPYHNYYVGECRSLIFGVSLTDYDFARGDGSDHGRPPTIVEKCVAAIDERGLTAEGIYRISGRHAGVQKMIQDIELDENKFFFNENDDIFCISNVLKQYLRELPEPVFHLPHAERVKQTENRDANIAGGFSHIKARLRRMAPIHQTTFQALIEHLKRVADHSSENKMDAKNLAVVFNTVLFGQDQVPTDGNVLAMHLEKDTVLEDIITHADLLFSAEDSPLSPPALPARTGLAATGVAVPLGPEDGPKPGSSRTKIQIIKPGDQSGTKSPGSGGKLKSPIFENEEPVMPAPTFTPDEELELLFDTSLIPQSMRDAVGEAYHVRPLASSDLMRSHFGLLQTLTIAPPIAPSVYKSLFSHLKSCPETYYIIVIVDRATDQLVAHGTVILERKYIHGGSIAGHLEDIVVSPNVRGGGLGKKLVVGLRDLGVAQGAYKINLGCKTDRIPFYEKCGFYLRANEMSHYRSTKDITPQISPEPTSRVPLPKTGGPPSSHASDHLVPPAGAAASVIDLTRSPTPSSEGKNSLEQHADEDTAAKDEGSPKTITTISSESGVTGITYHFPTTSSTAGDKSAGTEDTAAAAAAGATESGDAPTDVAATGYSEGQIHGLGLEPNTESTQIGDGEKDKKEA